MKIEKKRLTELVNKVATLFFVKVEAKSIDNKKSHTESIADVIGEILLHGNALTKMTFQEAILLITDHEDAIMRKLVELAHKDNPSHDCQTCVLLYLCNPTEEQQKEHKETNDAIDKLGEPHNIEGFAAFLKAVLGDDFEIEVAREGKIVRKDDNDDVEEELEKASGVLEKILKDIQSRKK
jgi:hypothetical protein